jgi:hypothetical protein
MKLNSYGWTRASIIHEKGRLFRETWLQIHKSEDLRPDPYSWQGHISRRLSALYPKPV